MFKLITHLISFIINILIKVPEPVKLTSWIIGKALVVLVPIAIIAYSVIHLTNSDSKKTIRSVEESRTLILADNSKKSTEAIQDYIKAAKQSDELVEQVRVVTHVVAVETEKIKVKRDIRINTIRKKDSVKIVSQPVVDNYVEESRANIDAMWESYCLVNKECGVI